MQRFDIVKSICYYLASLISIVVLCSGRSAIAIGRGPSHGNSLDQSSGDAPAVFTLRESFYHGLSETDTIVTTQHTSWNHALRVVDGGGVSSFELSSQTRLTVAASLAKGHMLRERADDRWIRPANDNAIRPNMTDKKTIVNLAKMTSDAYVLAPGLPDWFDLNDGFNRSQSFGWQNDGLRGHVFANADNSTVVVSFKGTTIDPRERTRSHDRENDNVLFSCCCATQRADPFWYGKVCDCRTDTFSCSSTCLTEECVRSDRYYATGMEVFQNITAAYPQAQFWLAGHSLGGAIASLVGMTFNVPAVSFESPPERLPALRLGLVFAEADNSITYHFGNTADPIYMGACNGLTSSCSIAGFAFESQCFTGRRCVYDTVGDKGWHVNVLNHRINTVITDVLEAYDSVPNCTADDECVDCYNWNFS